MEIENKEPLFRHVYTFLCTKGHINYIDLNNLDLENTTCMNEYLIEDLNEDICREKYKKCGAKIDKVLYKNDKLKMIKSTLCKEKIVLREVDVEPAVWEIENKERTS